MITKNQVVRFKYVDSFWARKKKNIYISLIDERLNLDSAKKEKKKRFTYFYVVIKPTCVRVYIRSHAMYFKRRILDRVN